MHQSDSSEPIVSLPTRRPDIPALLPYQLAAIDIDDTLVGPDRIISAANQAAIARIRSLGVTVILASGRSHANMAPFHRQLGLCAPMISANGSLVRKVDNGEIWAEHGLPTELVPELIQRGRELGLSILLYGLGGICVDRRTSYTAYDQSRNDDPQILVGDLMELADTAVYKLFWMADPEVIASLTSALTEEYAGRLTVTNTDPPYLEFMPPGVSKATGLAAVARRYGVDPAHVVAFGDGNNDAAMLQWAGNSFAMSHARPSAKAAAQSVTPDGPVEDSLARAIQILLEQHDIHS